MSDTTQHQDATTEGFEDWVEEWFAVADDGHLETQVEEIMSDNETRRTAEDFFSQGDAGKVGKEVLVAERRDKTFREMKRLGMAAYIAVCAVMNVVVAVYWP